MTATAESVPHSSSGSLNAADDTVDCSASNGSCGRRGGIRRLGSDAKSAVKYVHVETPDLARLPSGHARITNDTTPGHKRVNRRLRSGSGWCRWSVRQPLTLTHLRNMATVTEAGGIIAPPVAAFDTRPNTRNEVSAKPPQSRRFTRGHAAHRR